MNGGPRFTRSAVMDGRGRQTDDQREAQSTSRRSMRQTMLDVLSLVGLAAYVSGVGFLVHRITLWFLVSFGLVWRSVGFR